MDYADNLKRLLEPKVYFRNIILNSQDGKPEFTYRSKVPHVLDVGNTLLVTILSTFNTGNCNIVDVVILSHD